MKIDTRFIYHKTPGQMAAERGLQSGGRVQKYIDTTVLRLSDPYVPFLSGQLKTSGILGTVVGNGMVVYNAPYAKRQYYTNSGHGKQGTAQGGLRGRYWFKRMKADRLNEIIQGAANIAGGRAVKK